MFAIRRTDIYLLAGVLLAALAAFLLMPLLRPPPGEEVLITVNGQEYVRVQLQGNQTVAIDCGEERTNVLVVTDEGFYMESANCRDQLCIQQGKVTTDNYLERALGSEIICLPHRVVCSLLPINHDPAAQDAADW